MKEGLLRDFILYQKRLFSNVSKWLFGWVLYIGTFFQAKSVLTLPKGYEEKMIEMYKK